MFVIGSYNAGTTSVGLNLKHVYTLIITTSQQIMVDVLTAELFFL